VEAARTVSPATSRADLPRAEAPYTARAIKGTALLDEMRSLLRAWKPGETGKDFRKRARAEDLLGKAAASRSDDLVRRVFEPRFLADGQEPAASVRSLLDARGSGSWFAPICLLVAARADVVLREAVTVVVHSARKRGASTIATPDLAGFLEAQQERGRMLKPWSRAVRDSVAQHVLHQLTDLGVLGAPRRGARPLLPYSPGSLPIAWLACELHRRGISDTALVAHGDWAVWQLAEPDVREALDRLSDLGLWVYQGAGSIVRMAWPWSDWQTVLAVLGDRSHWGETPQTPR
jgi:hypothetical protein